MNKIFKTASLVAASLLIAMSSCKPADEATPVETPESTINATLSTGTVKGKAFIDTDLTEDGEEDAEDRNSTPAEGLQILVSATYEVNGENEVLNKFVTVDNNGVFEFTMPAEAEGTTIDLEFLKLEGTQTRDVFLPGETDTDEVPETGFYEFNDASVTLKPGKVEILENQIFTGFTSTAQPSFF